MQIYWTMVSIDTWVWDRRDLANGTPRSRGDSFPVPAALWTAGKREREGRPGSVVPLRPEVAVMSLDDGPADGQADPHPVALGRVEGVEELVHALRIEANAGIAHGDPHTVGGLAFGSDQQVPRTVVDANHRIRRVAEQVQDHLLELDPIGCEGRKILGELRLKHDAVSLKG